MSDNIQCFIHSQQNILVQAEIMRIKIHKLKAESLCSLCYATRCRPRKKWPIFFLLSRQSGKKKKKDALPKWTCCMTLWMPLQAASLLASTPAVAFTNRSMDLFQAQVSSNLKCMSSLLWNNHSLWGSYCPHHSMNYAHGEDAFTCFPTCKFLRRLEYCCLLLSLTSSCCGDQEGKLQERRKAPDMKSVLKESQLWHHRWATLIQQMASDFDKYMI